MVHIRERGENNLLAIESYGDSTDGAEERERERKIRRSFQTVFASWDELLVTCWRNCSPNKSVPGMTRSQRYFHRGVSKTQVIPQFEELECPNLAIREFHLKHSLHLIGLFVFKHVRFVHFSHRKQKIPHRFNWWSQRTSLRLLTFGHIGSNGSLGLIKPPRLCDGGTRWWRQ